MLRKKSFKLAMWLMAIIFLFSSAAFGAVNTTCIQITHTDARFPNTEYKMYYGTPPPQGTVRACENTTGPCVPTTFLAGSNVIQGSSPIALGTNKSYCFETTQSNTQSITNFLAATAYQKNLSDGCTTCCMHWECESGLSNVISYTLPAAVLTYMIQTTSGSNGTVSPLGGIVISGGMNQTVTITPNACHKVATLLIDGSSTTPATSYSFTNVAANHTLDATFSLASYSVNASAGTGGTISPNGYSIVTCGGSPSFTITPSSGYLLTSLTDNGTNVTGNVVNGVYTASNVNANHTLVATFVDSALISKIGVFVPSAGKWYLDVDGDGTYNSSVDRYIPDFGTGLVNPIPITGKWSTSSATTNIGVFTAALDANKVATSAKWYLDIDGNGTYNSSVDRYITDFGTGLVNPIPITGKWTPSSAVTNIGVFSATLDANNVTTSAKWYLDIDGDGVYNASVDRYIPNFGTGLVNPIPITGDWNNDGTIDIGVYIPSTGKAYLDMDGDYMWNPIVDKYILDFGKGLSNPMPIIGKW